VVKIKVAIPIIIISVLNASYASAQSPAGPSPKFEVASIKPCKDGDAPSGGRRGGDGGSSSLNSSPGRLSLNCWPAISLIQMAYDTFANGQRRPPRRGVPIEGGPAWINSARYEINAKSESAQGQSMMQGSMLQALLEDRFQLKIHRETREVPVYALTMAKGGAKGLQPARAGECITRDPDNRLPPPAPGQPFPRLCGMFYPSATSEGPDVPGTTMASLCRQFSVLLDRDVIDKTGIAGVFDIHLEMSPADLHPLTAADGLPEPVGAAPTPRDSAGRVGNLDPTALLNALQNAVQKLGLKLESAKGPVEVLVIDHVEKPGEN